MDTEFEDFKSRIDLRVYAASKGFEIDRRESSRASTVMRSGAEKLIIRRDPDGHYVYFEAHNNHSGTIIDFVQHLLRVNFGLVRKELPLARPPGQSPAHG